jgi:hypothetical protein
MDYQNNRAVARPTPSLPHGAANPQALTRPACAVALIPPIELRRLVAAMVD